MDPPLCGDRFEGGCVRVPPTPCTTARRLPFVWSSGLLRGDLTSSFAPGLSPGLSPGEMAIGVLAVEEDGAIHPKR